MKVLLHDHVTSAGESSILLADDGGVDSGLIHRVLRPVDETNQVAVIEVIEAVHLVCRGNCAAEPRHDLCRQFEAQIHSCGADMKEDVARCCDGVMAAVDLTERVQFFRLRCPEEPVPCVGAKRHDT